MRKYIFAFFILKGGIAAAQDPEISVLKTEANRTIEKAVPDNFSYS